MIRIMAVNVHTNVHFPVTFSTDLQGANYVRTRGDHLAFYEDESTSVDYAEAPLTYDALWPTCEHGLSASLCVGPSHYPLDM